MKRFSFLLISLILFAGAVPVAKAAYDRDLSLAVEDVRFSDNVIDGKTVRIYTKVRSNSATDLGGVIKIYDEREKAFVGPDLPVSVLAHATDDVFVDWKVKGLGEHPISVRLIPWETSGDNPDNNKVTKTLYVDVDSDKDGLSDRADSDDDNDMVADTKDTFPFDSKESLDTDHDKIGNNADTDDDNDGVLDVDDRFPTDAKETKDSDGDTVGDNSDPFPFDAKEWKDSDKDGIGDSSDPDNQNKAPIPSITTESKVVKTGKITTFSALGSKDPDGFITSYEWEFSDGAKVNGVVVDHVFPKPGTYTVTLKLTDNSNQSIVQTTQIVAKGHWALWAILGVTTVLIVLVALRKRFLKPSAPSKPAKAKPLRKKKK